MVSMCILHIYDDAKTDVITKSIDSIDSTIVQIVLLAWHADFSLCLLYCHIGINNRHLIHNRISAF